MIIGLLKPTEGQASVFGHISRAHTAATLARVSFVAQDHPLYRDFSVADMLRLGRMMNPTWDQGLALARMNALGIPPKRKVKSLSGGQQAQVSLTMALAKRAPLLVDEPGVQPGPDRQAGVHARRNGRHGGHRPDRPDRVARRL